MDKNEYGVNENYEAMMADMGGKPMSEQNQLTSEEIMKDTIWSAMTCAYKNALEPPGEGLLNFYTPESFVAELQVKLAKQKRLDRPELRCSKCGDKLVYLYTYNRYVCPNCEKEKERL